MTPAPRDGGDRTPTHETRNRVSETAIAQHTIHLTDAQLAQFTACGLIVVDGEDTQ